MVLNAPDAGTKQLEKCKTKLTLFNIHVHMQYRQKLIHIHEHAGTIIHVDIDMLFKSALDMDSHDTEKYSLVQCFHL